MGTVGWSARKEVHADPPLEVAGVPVDDLARPSGRDHVEDLLGQVAMGIEEPHAAAGIEILEDEIPEKGALAESCLPDDVEVARPIFGCEKHKPGVQGSPEGACRLQRVNCPWARNAPAPSSPARGLAGKDDATGTRDHRSGKSRRLHPA